MKFTVRGRVFYSDVDLTWKIIPIDEKGEKLLSAKKGHKAISFRKIFEKFKNDDIILMTFETLKKQDFTKVKE